MTEIHLRQEITEYLYEQDAMLPRQANVLSVKILCLIAGIYDYSFSDDMINELPQFIPSWDEIKKYR